MQQFQMKDVGRITPFFGDFGGMILPDAFSIEVQLLADQVKEVLVTENFFNTFKTIVSRLPEPQLNVMNDGGQKVMCVKSQARYYIVAGHIAMAKCRGIHQISISSGNDRLLDFAAQVSKDLELTPYIYLNAAQSANGALKQKLTEAGAVVDDTSCAKLYNRPYMYAFQKYIGDRANIQFVPDGAEMGCYPFPALSSIFAAKFGEVVREKLCELPAAVAATIQNGNAALAAFRAFEDVDTKLISVEEPVCQQFYVDSYGGAALSVRRAKKQEYNDVIAGELCNMWRMAKVIRLGAENYTKRDTVTERAVALIQQVFPDITSVLLVEGEDE